MPIPTPGNAESEREFISRCIEAISGEYDQDQASAICYRQWREGKSAMTKHAALLEAIRTRKGSGEFGYGITTADRYVQNAVDAIGKGAALKYFHGIGSQNLGSLLKRAESTLTICDEGTVTEQMVKAAAKEAATSIAAMKKVLGCDPPEHAMMAIVNRLTTPTEDRDGDTLQTKGARLDPKSPLLWQHIHTLPIGRMMRVVEHNDKLLKVATVLLDLNDLTADAAKLFEAGAMRFSHGFIAKEFEERKGKSDSGGVPRFNITVFDIVEESAVSVPSNVDAEVELFCRGKLASDVFKSHAKGLFDARKKVFAGAKFNPDQPRDENGRFGSTGGGSSGANSEFSATEWTETASGGSGANKWTEETSDDGSFVNYSAADANGYIAADGIQKAFSAASKGSSVRIHKKGDQDGVSGTVSKRFKNTESGKFAHIEVDTDSGTKKFSANGTYSQIWVAPKGRKDSAAMFVKAPLSLAKMFDVATQRVEPSTMEYDWAARFIGCAVKDLHVHTTTCNGMLIGAFLEGLEHACSKYKCQDTRNLDGEKEQPPVFELTEIDANTRKTFLIEGIRFYVGNGTKVVARVWKGWGAQNLVVYSEAGICGEEVIADAWKWVDENNPLKGQAFSLAGGWIPRTGTDWPDVFLEKHIEDALKRTVRIINEKGIDAANRGMILSGPPGTGKTLSARVMLNQTDCTFIWVSPKDFYKGAGFMDAFAMARQLAPSILMFEDIDNWISDYSVDLIKCEMDGLQQSSGVTTILTTNFPDQLPAALIDRPGRFHDVLEIHLPTRDVRLRMLQKWAAGASLDSLDSMADETNGYSGAHVYELCHFAKVIRDEDECSLDDALTKAFAKVKDQRDLINQNQLSGSSYRPGRRELQAAIAKGWTGHKEIDMASTLAAKEMGECGECGEKAMLNKDGYCAKCADKMAEEDGDETPAPKDDEGKSGKPSGTKAGRVLSRKNREKLEDAIGDMDDLLKIMELPRPAKALGGSARGKVKDVVDSSAVEPDDPQPTGIDHVMREAMSAATEDRAFRDRLRKGLDLLDQADETEQLADDFRQVERAMSSTG